MGGISAAMEINQALLANKPTAIPREIAPRIEAEKNLLKYGRALSIVGDFTAVPSSDLLLGLL